MKRLITLMLVGLMVFSSSIAVFAEAPEEAVRNRLFEGRQLAGLRRAGIEGLKEFTDEVHQINALRIEKNQLQIQVIEKQDQLVDLYLAASEAGDNEALKAAREERQKIKAIHEEIKTLREQTAAARKAYREAIKNEDMDAAEAELVKIIDAHKSINGKIEEKIEVLSTIMDILS